MPDTAPASPAPSSTGGALAAALVALREATAATRFELDIPGAEGARESGAELVRQLDDYVLPRLRRLDAPLLTVVGGSTGAGKSTVVNSLVREQVTPSGVLRPTTRSPVLVCHPDDLRWFSDTRVLPELTRTSGAGTDHRTLQLVTSPSLDPGLAFLDAPDIDSVVTANRRLATQLLAAADLWLFVTTAARYADAVPWDVLQTAQERGTALAMLLDRVPPGAEDDIAAHLREMLAAHGLAGAPLFVVPETTLHDGLLPDPVVAPLRGWFSDLARDAAHRAAVVRRTLDGALDSLRPAHRRPRRPGPGAGRRRGPAAGRCPRRLRGRGRRGRRGHARRLAAARGGPGALAGVRRHRGAAAHAAGPGRPAPGPAHRGDHRPAPAGHRADRGAGVGRGAARRRGRGTGRGAGRDVVADQRRGRPARCSRATDARLDRSSPNLRDAIERTVRDWQGAVLDLVRREGAGRRTNARIAAYGVNATGLIVMIAVFASTAFIPTGAEVGVAGGTTVLSQKVLEALFGDQAVRRLADEARADLRERVDALLASEESRFTDLLAAHATDPRDAEALERAAAAVEEAR